MTIIKHKMGNVRLFLDKQDDLPTLNSIGWELRTDNDKEIYDWNCTNRMDKQCLFQYTVAGEGELEVGGNVHHIKAGQAFLIEIPGPFSYRFPQGKQKWEYKYLSLTLNAYPLWAPLIENGGRIINLAPDSNVLQFWDKLFEKALTDQIKHIYDNSSYAYRFLMEVRHAVQQQSKPSSTPEPIQKCLHFIDRSFHKPIGLDEIAEAAGLSKFHLIRIFQKSIGESPINYLIKVRIKVAAQRLIENDLPIYEIANQCGFSSANYFSKVFQKHTSLTPSEFRNSVGKQQISEVFVK
ncbi:AraC family transcriptional regulator [Halalkalibacter sp. APA_J-10(15)]|uniref:helix-turn-helix domain-containing protein n=1 Tax=unclassified Halalkalibacter TaxID=2893063 RepID=UPI001FF3A16B|nr:AraC family transcriptional regulator [Halalkalibacter sp. APA_J-10(15)]MCK0470469.1 AraC family transcriptional regulator [Halalkalibacter sp. APA_J-10(15)]